MSGEELELEEIEEPGTSDYNRKGRILRALAEKGASYPSEIHRMTGLAREEIGELLYKLEEKGIVLGLTPHRYGNDPRLMNRRTELWKRGMHGQDTFKRMHWATINMDYEGVKEKLKEHGIEKIHRVYLESKFCDKREEIFPGSVEGG